MTDSTYIRTRSQFDKVRVILQEKHPRTFNSKTPRPLKTNISIDLVEDSGCTLEEVKSFLAIWCGSYAYNGAVMRGTFRWNLEGKQVGFITCDERIFACKKYHNYQMRRHNNNSGNVAISTVFTKANLALAMFSNMHWHSTEGSSVWADVYDLEERKFVSKHYRGDKEDFMYTTLLQSIADDLAIEESERLEGNSDD